MSSKRRILVICLCSLLVLSLTGCSNDLEVEVAGETLSGMEIIFFPAYFLWDWLWHSFTPNFWEFMNGIWTVIPVGISWFAGPICYALGAVLYACLGVILVIAYIIITILCGIVWFLLAVLNGIFNFY